ncbi:MAG: hypothetical protein HOO67_00975, partial [Candidatus Peribacteraceae bacterium]|nr:hypothetical protein [Candidatus Peribacteraceae bacterium]
MKHSAFAPGKIILSGEYAVVFGYPGIAVSANVGVEATWEETSDAPVKIVLKGLKGEETYARKIVNACIDKRGPLKGTITIKNDIPVGRGMGSSTALVIAICKCLLGDDRAAAVLIEDAVNPGNSGLDFAVIWANHPVKFKKGTAPEPLQLDLAFIKNSTLIDTGVPGETTAELVSWMRSRVSGDAVVSADTTAALGEIGQCTERLLAGADFKTVIRDHHHAQLALGVVTPEAQKIIT